MLRSAVTLALLCLLLAGGCAHHKKVTASQKINQWLQAQAVDLPAPVYRVEPPDVLLITAPKIKELDQHQQIVRPDGRITLNLVGELYVAGKTPDQIAREVRHKLRDYYDKESIDLAVQVVEFKSKSIYVFGQVKEPGPKPFTGRETVANILAQAQLSNAAWPQKIIVVRPSDEPGVRQKVTVDLKQMYQSGNLSNDYLLEEGDLVYVPPSPLYQISTKFNQIFSPLDSVQGLIIIAATGGI